MKGKQNRKETEMNATRELQVSADYVNLMDENVNAVKEYKI
jgi:hypothetical protein